MDEELFNDQALDKHLRVLVEEWKKYELIVLSFLKPFELC